MVLILAFRSYMEAETRVLIFLEGKKTCRSEIRFEIFIVSSSWTVNSTLTLAYIAYILLRTPTTVIEQAILSGVRLNGFRLI